ncbi:hypothetical protein MMC07_006979 [Pseudocyphellaria aurata]|nr:hypothetical protein [Pseudocyphellaria aurata]
MSNKTLLHDGDSGDEEAQCACAPSTRYFHVPPAQEELPKTPQTFQPSGPRKLSKKRKRVDDSFSAYQSFPSSEATKMSKQRRRAEDTFGADLYEEVDRQFRVLDDRIRWTSFLSHAWQPTYLAIISETFGEMPKKSSEFIDAKTLIQTRVKNWKHAVLYQCEQHIRQLYKEIPSLQPMRKEDALHSQFLSSYSIPNFLFIWNYMKKFLDVERSSELGQFYCKSLYVNLCVQTKKWMDVKDSGKPAKIARRKLLTFYDVIPTHDDFQHVTKEEFCVLEDGLRNETKTKKKTDLLGLDKFQSLGPPPSRSLFAT